MGLSGPLGGGPISNVALVAGAQLITPSTTLSDWSDPNSVLSSVTIDADGTITATLQNKAPGRDTPTTGASILLPLKNLYGAGVSAFDTGGIIHPILKFDATASIPSYTWASLGVTRTGSVTSSGFAHGCQNDSTGIGASIYYSVGAGWNVYDPILFVASGARGVLGRIECSADGATMTSTNAVILDANGNAAGSSRQDNTNRVLASPAPLTLTYAILSFGWTSASGTNGAQIKVRPWMIAHNAFTFPGVR